MGLLSSMGALNGLGQGVTETGQQAQRVDMAKTMNELETTRGESLERLRAADEKDRQAQAIQAEKDKTQQEITGHSAVAQFERSSIASENQKNRDAAAALAKNHGDVQLTIAQGHDTARVKAAEAHAAGSNPKPPVREWYPGTVKNTSDITKPDISVMNNRDGSQWVPVGGNYYRYDPTQPGGYKDPKSTARAPAADVSALIRNPLATLPSGITTRDYFEQKWGYLPAPYLGAANAAREQAGVRQQPSSGIPSQGGSDDGSPVPENEDPSESEADPTLPPSQ